MGFCGAHLRPIFLEVIKISIFKLCFKNTLVELLWKSKPHISGVNELTWCKETQWAHDAIMTWLWRQNDIATSFWRHNDVIASYVRWVYFAEFKETSKLYPVPVPVWQPQTIVNKMTNCSKLIYLFFFPIWQNLTDISMIIPVHFLRDWYAFWQFL